MVDMKNESGSMTIETAIILPLLIFILLSMISAGLFLHDRYVDDVEALMGVAKDSGSSLVERGEYPLFIPGMSDLIHISQGRSSESFIQAELGKQWEIFYMVDVAFYYAERLTIVQEILEKKDEVVEAILDVVR